MKQVRKAVGAAIGAGLGALAGALPDGITEAEAWTIAAALVGAAAVTWGVGPNVPTYHDTPQDTL